MHRTRPALAALLCRLHHAGDRVPGPHGLGYTA
jgi:hypothetical protein